MHSRLNKFWLIRFLLILSVIVAALVAMPAIAANKVVPKPTIVVFGDSLSASYGLQPKQGWVALLEKQLIAQKYQYQVVNASVSGETTSGGLSRFSDMLSTHKPTIVIIALGGNDGLRGLSASEMYNNLDSMMMLAKPAKILLLGMKIPPNYGLKYSAEFSNNYQKLAKKHKAKLVPFFLDGVAGKPSLMQDDGLHPAAIAQPILLKNTYPTLKLLLKK